MTTAGLAGPVVLMILNESLNQNPTPMENLSYLAFLTLDQVCDVLYLKQLDPLWS